MNERIENCRSCGEPALDQVFELGSFAFTGRFPEKDETNIPEGPLELMFCHHCGLVQLAHNFDADELYRHHYGYRSGINASMRNHLAEIVTKIHAKTPLGNGDTVLDIGSNDGTLLGNYDIAGIRRIGFDPTIEQYGHFYPPEVCKIADYFTAEGFHKVSESLAKVITSISMFYDLPDPNAFVADIASCLRKDGLWVLEQSYILRMLEQNAFDTICHEHLEYYGLKQISDIVSRQGLRVFDVSFNDCNGGSFRVFVCHEGAAFGTTDIVGATLEKEKNLDLNTPAPFLALKMRAETLRNELNAFLDLARENGETVFLYGASTKGNTLLQYCGIDKNRVEAAADRNPKKWGCRTPLTNIPIISEQEARDRKPDYFLVLPWHFRNEFLERERSFLRAGGRMVFPLPHLTICSV